MSGHLVALVELVFALVVAQSLADYRDVLLRPYEHYVGALGLLVVIVCTGWSWIDWHVTMERYPYDVACRSPHRRSEELRVWSDLAIVIVYAYLLFAIEPFDDLNGGSMVRYVLAFPLIFALYFVSGWLRVRRYEDVASNYPPIFISFGYFTAVASIYIFFAARSDYRGLCTANVICLLMLFVGIFAYRIGRRRYANWKAARA